MARVNAITQFLPATHTTILTLLGKLSPDGTTRTRRHASDIAYYSIYRPRKDGKLSWPSWLTYSGRLTHKSGHPSAAGRAWDRKVRRSKTNDLTAVPHNQPRKAQTMITDKNNSTVPFDTTRNIADANPLSELRFDSGLNFRDSVPP